MNTLFRQQVQTLFEKLAWPHDPAVFAEQPRTPGDHGAAAARPTSRVRALAHAEGSALFRELGAAGKHLMAKPALLSAGAGALMLAPILGGAFYATQQKHEGDLMNRQMNPTTKMGNFLESFLEKKGAAQARAYMMPAIRGHMHESFTGGLGKGIGQSVADAILGGVGGAFSHIHQSLIVDPQRKHMFESVLRTDPVVHDALTRNPDAAKTLSEAYQTMVRFAPSLSLDVNAVRSFLREAVVGGSGGVNYATIKTLIETEKGLRNTGDHR